MSIKLTDELLSSAKNGKIASAKQVFLDGDKENLQQIGEKTNQLVGAFEAITPNGGASKADAVSYKNTTSGMTAVTAQGAIDELAAKNKSQDETISSKAEKSAVDTELAKKFDKESILQESGDAEDKVMSQKAVSTKLSDLTSEIVRSEISVEETVENKYVHSNKQIQDDSRYKQYSMDYYPVEPNKFFRIIGTTKGINVAAIALLADKEATEALSVYDVSKTTDGIVNADRVLFIPEGVSYVVVSRNKIYTSKCYVVGEGESRLDMLENDKVSKTDMDTALAKKFNKENITQELGDSESKTLSQKISSYKISMLTSEIVRSEISVEETVENKYVHSNKQIQDDSRYKQYSMDYYPVEPNKFFRIIGTTKGINVAAIALLADKEATEALSVYDVSKTTDGIVNADRVLFIPEGVSYVVVSRNKIYTSKLYIVGEGTSRLDMLENDLNSLNTKLDKKVDMDTVETKLENKFKGKILLAIGDSVTAQKYWQNQVGEVLGMKVRTHAKGGIGIIQMVDGDGSGDAPEGYDPDSFGTSRIYKLNTEDVKDVSIIVIMGFYNERNKVSTEHGEEADMYPDNDTYIGRLNYAIKRIYEELANANNNTCRIIICSAHRYGKYPYSDQDAYSDGDTILQYTKVASDYNSLPCIDLMHNGGINKYNWNLFQSGSTDYNQKYIPADGLNDATNKPFESLESVPDPSLNNGLKVTVGTKSNYKTYISNGSNWIIDSARYPWIGDHLHLNEDGGKLLGNYIAAQLLSL